MIKKYILSILLSGSLSFVQAQKTDWIIGRWQFNQAELTSMNFDLYEFQKDGIFMFHPEAYNGLNRIIEIEGAYLINGDSIVLTPKYTKELIGGYPVRSEVTTLSDTWEILGGKIKRVKCKKNVPQKAYIHYNFDEKVLILDTYKYYKIE